MMIEFKLFALSKFTTRKEEMSLAPLAAEFPCHIKQDVHLGEQNVYY